MRRFAYRFQTILNLKTLKEEVKIKEFAEIVNLLYKEQGLLQNWIQELDGCQTLLVSGFNSNSGVSGLELIFYQEYVLSLEQAIRVQEEKIRLLLEALEEKREELIQSSKEKKVFENILKQDYKVYCSLFEKEESKFLDEVTMVQNHLKRKEVKNEYP
ncbi:MAG: flagellar export protein FliJ [Firmicutes bacterium]|nr:flagellar export protein FliJ [Bacillota bacterium]